MTGLVTLQQGPLGVAASASRPVSRPGEARQSRISDTTGARLDPGAPNLPAPHPREEPDSEQFQPLAAPVSPSTLLEASLIFAALSPGDEATGAAPTGAAAGWSPPPSGLALRDRSV